MNISKNRDITPLKIEAATKFEPTAIVEHFNEVWNALKLELLPGGGNKEVHEAALNVISTIIKKFNNDQQNGKIILDSIFTTTIGTLLNRESKLYKPTLDIVTICASATDESFAYVINKFLPITLTDLTSNDEITEADQINVLEDLRTFMAIASEKFLLGNYASDNCVLNIQKELMKVLMASHGSADLLRVTWMALTSMAKIITEDNRHIVYKKLNTELTAASPAQAECLLSLAMVFPHEVHKFVLTSYIERSYQDPQEAKKIFTILATLLVVPELRDIIIEVLCLNVFHNKSTAIQVVILEVLNSILKTSKSPGITKILYNDWRIVTKLVDLIKNEVPDTQDVMYEASLVMNLVIKELPHDQQMALVEEYLPLMKLEGSISDLYVTSGLLGFLDPAIPIEEHFEQLVNDLTTLSLVSDDENARKLANQLLCSLFNRAPADDKHRKVLHKIFSLLKSELRKGNHKAAEILGWLSKGLLARGHPDAAEILETIAELLDHPRLSKAAELAFEIISTEFPLLHLPLLKYFYKQKIFQLAMKFLEEKIEKFSEHHLTAMAHVLQITPHLVLGQNIEKVGPILFKCIQAEGDGGNQHAKRIVISLKIINNFILDKSEYMLNHLQHLVKDLLKLTQFKSSMEVRVMACKCLENLIKFPLFTLVPYKNDVVHELAVALDDHKRLVRTSAVSARMAWFLLGENEASK